MVERSQTKGLVLCSVVGCTGWILGSQVPSLGSAGLAFVLGILFSVLRKPDAITLPGIRFCESKILKLAIICLGAKIAPSTLVKLDAKMLVSVCIAVTAPLVVGWLWSRKKEGCGRVLLVAIGTAICGSAAIAASSPLMKRVQAADAAAAIAVVNFLGMLGLFVLPMLDFMVARELVVVLIGDGLHAVGHVAAAGFAMGPSEGDLAMLLKMGRVTMLIPVLMFLTIRSQGSERGLLGIRPPLYLVSFLLLLALNASGVLPESARSALGVASKGLMAVAMAALGMRIELLRLRQQAGPLLGIGVACWAAQLLSVSLWMVFA